MSYLSKLDINYTLSQGLQWIFNRFDSIFFSVNEHLISYKERSNIDAQSVEFNVTQILTKCSIQTWCVSLNHLLNGPWTPILFEIWT